MLDAKQKLFAHRKLHTGKLYLHFFPRLKLELGDCTVKVRGHKKVFSPLMFGVLTLAAEQLLRLLVRVFRKRGDCEEYGGEICILMSEISEILRL